MRLGTALAFAGALLLYWVCVDPAASFWDCPEYILVAYRMEIGHPPGNPAWQLMANVASHLAPSPRLAALAINLTSGLVTALAVALLFQILYSIISYAVPLKNRWLTGVAALSGTWCFAWADSTIFSAVETEVYALSIFFTALMFRLMLKWAETRDSNRGRRILICLAYLTGLSLGVHELNLLVIPALALIYTFRRYPGKATLKAWGTIFISFIIVGFILLFWFPHCIEWAAQTDVFTTNTFGWHINTGAIVFVVLLLVFLCLLPFIFARLKFRTQFITMAWGLFFLTLGSCVYMVIPIRASANPPVNEGDPSNAYSLLAYIKRDQYGTKPLFYGHTPYSEPLRIEEIDSCGTASYTTLFFKKKRPLYAPWRKGGMISNRRKLLTESDSLFNSHTIATGHGYVRYGYVTDYIYPPELNMWFPRMTSSDPDNIEAYGDWTGMSADNMIPITASNAVDPLGNPIIRKNSEGKREGRKTLRPSYLQQLSYMLGYQFGYMYFRYLMWNFAGRQNNYPATGEIDHGNFITGLKAADDAMLGDTDSIPPELWENNRGHNNYYLIPFIIGLIGAIGSCFFRQRGKRTDAVVLILFLMTGLAIVFYLNQNPGEARERDYSFLGSFMAFSIWIGLGCAILMALAGKFRKYLAVLIIGVPFLMLSQTYDDHNRSARDSAGAIAENILSGLERDAILFVDGDNLTFPLWYAQEVLGVRRDVAVINLTYLSTSWYAPQFQMPGEERPPLRMSALPQFTDYDAFSIVKWNPAGKVMDALEALKMLYSEIPEKKIPVIDASAVRLPLENGDSMYISLRDLASGNSTLQRYHLNILDILANNAASKKPRAVYWQRNIPARAFISLKDSTRMTLGVRKFMAGVPNADEMVTTEGLKSLTNWKAAGDTGCYQEPYVGVMISWQRISIIMLAKELQKQGRYAEAISTLDRMLTLFPFSAWGARTVSADGETICETHATADILETSGRAIGNKEAIRKANLLRKSENERAKRFRLYREILGPTKKAVMSADTRCTK